MRGLAISLALIAIAGAARAQSLAVDPNRPVRGSCGEVLQPLFAAVRAAAVSGDIGRMEVEVTSTQQGEKRVLSARAVASRNFDSAAQQRVLAAFQQAYEAPPQEDCVGVITRRSRWIVRKGDVAAMWTPDNPTIINRPVAATTLPDGATRIELLDPALGFSRIYGPEPALRGRKCFELSAMRETGVMPPLAAMAPGSRYQVRFRLDEAGRVGVVRLPEDVAPGSSLAEALEHYVRAARYYPRIGEDCQPQPTWLTIVSERPA